VIAITAVRDQTPARKCLKTRQIASKDSAPRNIAQVLACSSKLCRLNA